MYHFPKESESKKRFMEFQNWPNKTEAKVHTVGLVILDKLAETCSTMATLDDVHLDNDIITFGLH